VQQIMLDITRIKVGVKIGPSIAVTHTEEPASSGKPPELSPPLRGNLQRNPDVLSLLSWRSFLSKFVGFDQQMDDLREWAMSDEKVSVKFIVGDGGMGKTRTAAEFAWQLYEEDEWAAGFVDLRKPSPCSWNENGNLLIIDYPEEHRPRVAELLADLDQFAKVECPRLRVLFLTRRSVDDWYELITDCNANNFVDMTPLRVQGLTAKHAYAVFCSAQEGAAEHLDTAPEPVQVEALEDWLKLAPENDRALFIVALGVHSALNPNDPVVQYTGPQVVQAIIDREVSGLRTIATNTGLSDEYALARVLSLAAIAGDITDSETAKMAKSRPDLFGLQPGDNIRKALRLIAVGPERLIPAPKPDILAAALVTRALREDPETAPELIWAGLAPDIVNGLNRLARLSYDAEIVLELHRHRIRDWLAQAVQGRKERCEFLRPYVSEAHLPVGWTDAAIAVWRTLLDFAETEEERAKTLNNLSNGLSDAGDNPGALDAIREAVEIRRRLAHAQPARFEPDLAMSLANLGLILRGAGEHNAGNAALVEAGELLRPYALQSPNGPHMKLFKAIESML